MEAIKKWDPCTHLICESCYNNDGGFILHDCVSLVLDSEDLEDYLVVKTWNILVNPLYLQQIFCVYVVTHYECAHLINEFVAKVKHLLKRQVHNIKDELLAKDRIAIMKSWWRRRGK
jgi:hypothetical protein